MATPITRRRFLGTTLAGATGALFARTARGSARQRPNILFFLADDQRADILGCAGHPILRTPVIDGLAGGGVRFTNAFVTTAICAASRASILTGLHERTHGYTFGMPPVHAMHAAQSYPALLRGAGYRTGFFGKFGIQMDLPPEALFDTFEMRDQPYWQDGRHIDELNAEGAIRFLAGHDARQPFCLSVSFSSPHANDGDFENHYPCIDAVKGMYEDQTMPPPRLNDPAIFERHPEFLRNSMNRIRYHWRWDTPEKYQKNMRAYFRMLRGVDLLVGRVLETLAAQGLADNTVVVYAADNGYYMAERGFAGKWSHYEESLRVPLILHDPRLSADRQGKVCEAMALNLDLPATFLALGGVAQPGAYPGRSLLPWCAGAPPSDWRTAFFCEHRMNHPDIPKWEGVRDTRYVYALYYEQDPVYEFLHDLQTDPEELVNLAGDPGHTAVLSRLRTQCTAMSLEYGTPRPS